MQGAYYIRKVIIGFWPCSLKLKARTTWMEHESLFYVQWHCANPFRKPLAHYYKSHYFMQGACSIRRCNEIPMSVASFSDEVLFFGAHMFSSQNICHPLRPKKYFIRGKIYLMSLVIRLFPIINHRKMIEKSSLVFGPAASC